MISTQRHDYFSSSRRHSRSCCNNRCQNILYKAVFEHFAEAPETAAFLLTSKSFQNSSFGANFLASFTFNDVASKLFNAVLSPSSCFSLQFTPSLYIENSQYYSQKIENDVTNFVTELVRTKYFPLQLPSLTLSRANDEMLSACFDDSVAWRNLRTLNLEYNRLDDSRMAGISKTAPHVTSLNLRSCRISSNIGFQHLAELAGLTSLDLSYVETIHDLCLEHLSKCSNMLTYLNLSDCRKVTDAGFEHLSTVAGLTTLILNRCNITDVGLQHIAKLSNIGCLDLELSRKITDVGIEHISTLDGISTLFLSSIHVTDAGLRHVARLSQIRNLDLSFCEMFTDAGIAHVSTLPNVTNLNLRGCGDNVSDACLQDISKMATIETLDLSQCVCITDVGMEYVSRLGRITDLDLSYTKMTDDGLAFVAKLSNLTVINLNNCEKITDVGVRRVAEIPGIIDIDVRRCDQLHNKY